MACFAKRSQREAVGGAGWGRVGWAVGAVGGGVVAWLFFLGVGELIWRATS
ncbi:MAG: hypothetical protein NTX13_09545 [Acidobacteria bacterium]|nr:hypothetical protein [Acidobacteriota bacterium]